jgi:hypothetical protein
MQLPASQMDDPKNQQALQLQQQPQLPPPFDPAVPASASFYQQHLQSRTLHEPRHSDPPLVAAVCVHVELVVGWQRSQAEILRLDDDSMMMMRIPRGLASHCSLQL